MAVEAALTTRQVHAVRTIGLWTARVIAAILICVGHYLVLKRTIFGLLIGDLTMPFVVFEDVGETHSASRGLAMALIGTAMWFLSRRAMALIFPMPYEGCPRCSYPFPEDAEGNEGDRCPECGYRAN